MNSALPRALSTTLFSITLLALAACGGGKEDAPQPACPACPVCEAPPTPAAQEPPIEKVIDDLREQAVKKFRINAETFKGAATQAGISDKLGKKDCSAEDFPRFVNFFWQVDSEFRIQYLRAMMTSNRLVDMLKPAVGKFDPNISPKDLEAEDISLLLSQTIVDWAQVQRTLEDDFKGMGVENVMGVKPSDEMPHAEAMMREMLELVKPAETPTTTPGPQATSAGVLTWLVGDAQAQQMAPVKGKPILGKSKAVPRVKVKQAPLLLARVISFNVGGQNFVLRSPLMAAEPVFQAIAVDQFQFNLEKMSVGPGYRDAVDNMVQALAAKPSRDIIDWWKFSHGVTELRLLNQLVDMAKVEAAPVQPAPLQPAPASGGIQTSPQALPASGGITAQPQPASGGIQTSPSSVVPSGFAPSGGTPGSTTVVPERQNPDAAQPRPATAPSSAPSGASDARPSTAPSSVVPSTPRKDDGPASAAQPQPSSTRPAGPSGSQPAP